MAIEILKSAFENPEIWLIVGGYAMLWYKMGKVEQKVDSHILLIKKNGGVRRANHRVA